jgi:Flp pilus assembly protein TadD
VSVATTAAKWRSYLFRGISLGLPASFWLARAARPDRLRLSVQYTATSPAERATSTTEPPLHDDPAHLSTARPTRVAGSRERRARGAGAFSALCLLLVLAAFAALAFLSGGYVLQRTAPVLFVLAALAVVAVWRARGLERPARPYSIALLAFAAFVAWTGASILWSSGPDLSLYAFAVALLYLLVMVAVAVLPCGVGQLRLVAGGFALIVLVVCVYALLGKAAPDVVTHAHVFARLRAPVGYWNVLAVLAVMAVPVVLTAATGPSSVWWLRGLAASALVVLAFTFFFTFSRGGYVALAGALIVYFVFASRRLPAAASLAVAAGVTTLALIQVRHLGTLFSPTTDDALRASQGHALAGVVAVALVAAFAAQGLLVLGERRWSPSPRQARLAGVAIVVAVCLVPLLLGVAYASRHGGTAWISAQYHAALSPGGPSNDVQRLTSLGTSGRVPWYRSAILGFIHHPVAGTGAGTFVSTNYLYRSDTLVVRHSHSQWLNVLSELGLVGLVLFAVAVAGLVAAAFGRPLLRRGDPHRGLLAACQAAVVAFVVHMSIDWDWDMTSVTIAFLLLAGVCAGYIRDCERQDGGVTESNPGSGRVARRRQAARARRKGAPTTGMRVLATAVIAFAVVCWALPYLAERATREAQYQLSSGDPSAAEAAARRAVRLAPLSVDPLLALADAQAQSGRPEAAAATLQRAVRLQPDNYEPYYRMGELVLQDFHDPTAARAWFEKALTLNPRDPLINHALSAL